jgi:predicted CopG family antitoxin
MPFKTISVDLDAHRALKSTKQSKRTIESPPARNFSELLEQLRNFAGKGVFTATERAELRRRQRQPLRSRPRVKRPGDAS